MKIKYLAFDSNRLFEKVYRDRRNWQERGTIHDFSKKKSYH